MAESPELERFEIAPDDPLADEHAAVSAWVEEAFGSLSEHNPFVDVELKTFPSGRRLLDGKPEQSRRYLLAAVEQVRHWERQARHGSASSRGRDGREAPARGGGGRRPDAPGLAAGETRPDGGPAVVSGGPDAHTVLRPDRADHQGARALRLDDARRSRATPAMGTSRRGSAHRSRRTSAGSGPPSSGSASMKAPGRLPMAPPAAAVRPPPTPAPAGSAGVLVHLKRFYGMLPDADAAPAPPIEPDLFVLAEDSPLRPEHELLTAVFRERIGEHYIIPDLPRLEARRTLLALEPGAMGRAVLAAAERHIHALLAPQVRPFVRTEETPIWQSRNVAAWTMASLLKSHFELRRDGLFDLLLYLSSRPPHEHTGLEKLVRTLIEQAEGEAARSPLSEGERYVLAMFRKAMGRPGPGSAPEEVQRLTRLIGDGVVMLPGDRRGVGRGGQRRPGGRRTGAAGALGEAARARPDGDRGQALGQVAEGGPEARGCDRRRRRPRETPEVVPPLRAGGRRSAGCRTPRTSRSARKTCPMRRMPTPCAGCSG